MSILKSYPEKVLEPRQLQGSLDYLIENLIKNLVENKQITESEGNQLRDRKDDLVEQVFEMLQDKHQEITPEKFNDPTFIKQMFATLITSLILEKDLDPELKAKLAKNKDPLKKPEDLKNIFTPEELKKLQNCLDDIHNSIKKLYELEKKQPKKETTMSADPNTNLLGLISSYTTGSIAAVVQFCWGNENNIPDQNPQHGTAQIDARNKIDDPLDGISNIETIKNYLKIPGQESDLIDDMVATINRRALLEPKSPK